MKFIARGLLSVLFLSAAGFAWDGQRQGFLLGIGAGAASMSEESTKTDATQYSYGVPVTTSRIGYAWDNQHAIELYGNTMFDNPTNIAYSGIDLQVWNADETQANTWFGGIGLITAQPGIDTHADGQYPASYGFGGNFGYGFEFAKHASVDLNLLVGFVDVQNYSDGNLEPGWTKSGSAQGEILAGFSVSVELLGY
jgi:hypothetical protein